MDKFYRRAVHPRAWSAARGLKDCNPPIDSKHFRIDRPGLSILIIVSYRSR